MRRIGFILILTGFAAVLFLMVQDQSLETVLFGSGFQEQWALDIRNLQKAKKIPNQLGNLRDIEMVVTDPDVQAWLGRVEAPFSKSQDGLYRLEVIIDPWKDGFEYGVLVQHHLVELKSGNTVWELGRSYLLGRHD